ncbi:small terminase subunit [Pseudomonas phage B3]|uniref:Small terminase subunit n=3 Tax=root TaxID=1 RepID=Q5ZQY6_9CAUD|nr:terminase small subunit [Pseudomonas phage B3]AAQ13948.1 small terminase subunit [Pseudomonas phage B3]
MTTMGRKSSISRLPDQVRAYIEGRLADGRMTLDELIADLQAQFPSQAEAGELPSRAAVHRYGQKLERRLAAIRASTEAAKLIRAQAGDDLDARSEALTAMIQSELFESIISLQEAGDEEMDPADRVGLLASAAKNIATLTRSSVTLKKFQAEAEERARQALLAEQKAKLDAMPSKGGVTEATKQAIREALGIN